MLKDLELISQVPPVTYSKEPKSVTSFNVFTFFHVDINQSELEESFQLASDCIESCCKALEAFVK